MTFALYFTDKFGEFSKGSGVPEVRALINGAGKFSHFVTVRTLLAKMIGLVLSIGSGNWVGKVGPFIHISAATATQLFRFFPFINKNPDLKNQLIGTGAAVGVAASIGSV